jgi:hypothetical protein
VSFASARALQGFLAQNSDWERDGWNIQITHGPLRGYDGKPLHQLNIQLSTALPSPEPPTSLPASERSDDAVHDSGTENPYGTGVVEERPQARRREHLTWQEQMALQQASKALLVQLGVSDLGRWR